MGQAKSRGNKEERIAAAIARQEALKPREMICNDCKTVITAEHIELLDTRNISGLDMACAGICPECRGTTYGFKGTQEAMQAVAEGLENEMPGMIGAVQNYKPHSK